jgi:hypothetical protein
VGPSDSADTATRNDKLKDAHDRLTQAVEGIVTGDDWQRMLKVASKFHRYRFNNHRMEPHSIDPPASAWDLVRGRANCQRSCS